MTKIVYKQLRLFKNSKWYWKYCNNNYNFIIRPEIIIFISFDATYVFDLFVVILGAEQISADENEIHGVKVYPWHISTKYYETDVYIYTLSQKQLLPEQLAGGVQAVILAFDSSKVSQKLISLKTYK